eukprot:TRINITY_DN2980_c0_g1_i1.p1 TRINITY_DN2980_c0_g1~~TRINITY_DN2980_c0_g1_i1.p1  ORF type:complete len:360 (+),score=39.86 TRINITY_DN2980_c0_g1_i1:40-1080(+)
MWRTRPVVEVAVGGGGGGVRATPVWQSLTRGVGCAHLPTTSLATTTFRTVTPPVTVPLYRPFVTTTTVAYQPPHLRQRHQTFHLSPLSPLSFTTTALLPSHDYQPISKPRYRSGLRMVMRKGSNYQRVSQTYHIPSARFIAQATIPFPIYNLLVPPRFLQVFREIATTIKSLWDIRGKYKKQKLQFSLADIKKELAEHYVDFCKARASANIAEVSELVTDEFLTELKSEFGTRPQDVTAEWKMKEASPAVETLNVTLLPLQINHPTLPNPEFAQVMLRFTSHQRLELSRRGQTLTISPDYKKVTEVLVFEKQVNDINVNPWAIIGRPLPSQLRTRHTVPLTFAFIE